MSAPPQNVPCRVEKPWGYEIWWAHTELYAGKILHVEAGAALSLQYHERKDETSYLLRGRLTLTKGPAEDAMSTREVAPGESWRNQPGELHTIEALEDSDVLEVSTPDLDDVVRVRDRYGREGTSSPRSAGRRSSAASAKSPSAQGPVDADVKAVRDRRAVAEAPPSAPDRYFYFEDVQAHDSLFRHVAKTVLGTAPSRDRKAEALAQLRSRGVFLIDLRTDPVDGAPLTDHVPALVMRVRELAPAKVILIKATVYDAAFRGLRDAGVPVIDERIPFPGSGQQVRFAHSFERALRAADRSG
jgi:mannose-6-phosphate isomerase